MVDPDPLPWIQTLLYRSSCFRWWYFARAKKKSCDRMVDPDSHPWIQTLLYRSSCFRWWYFARPRKSHVRGWCSVYRISFFCFTCQSLFFPHVSFYFFKIPYPESLFRIRIHWFRILIQHFRLNTDPDSGFKGFKWPKIENFLFLFFWAKICIYLCPFAIYLFLVQHFKTWNFLLLLGHLFPGSGFFRQTFFLSFFQHLPTELFKT